MQSSAPLTCATLAEILVVIVRALLLVNVGKPTCVFSSLHKLLISRIRVESGKLSFQVDLFLGAMPLP